MPRLPAVSAFVIFSYFLASFVAADEAPPKIAVEKQTRSGSTDIFGDPIPADDGEYIVLTSLDRRPFTLTKVLVNARCEYPVSALISDDLTACYSTAEWKQEQAQKAACKVDPCFILHVPMPGHPGSEKWGPSGYIKGCKLKPPACPQERNWSKESCARHEPRVFQMGDVLTLSPTTMFFIGCAGAKLVDIDIYTNLGKAIVEWH
jgi:hypothetical protein